MNKQDNTKPSRGDDSSSPLTEETLEPPCLMDDTGIPILDDVVVEPAPSAEEEAIDTVELQEPLETAADTPQAAAAQESDIPPEEDQEALIKRLSKTAAARIIRKLEPRIRKEMEKAIRSGLDELTESKPPPDDHN
ncbi:MAG: hypothetical protein GY703_13705 [Gammaproteobacteria bacterium]|nr:hypothetical protein [Gammaproteobacteria bacterium]